MMDDWQLRHEIYRTFAQTGQAPGQDELVSWAGDAESAARTLSRLYLVHAVVLDAAGSIRMALPFSGVETDHRVSSGERSWWANCAWDALAIPAALRVDARIEAVWIDTGEPVGLAVMGGALSSTEGFVHFQIAARNWWDDIVET